MPLAPCGERRRADHDDGAAGPRTRRRSIRASCSCASLLECSRMASRTRSRRRVRSLREHDRRRRSNADYSVRRRKRRSGGAAGGGRAARRLRGAGTELGQRSTPWPGPTTRGRPSGGSWAAWTLVRTGSPSTGCSTHTTPGPESCNRPACGATSAWVAGAEASIHPQACTAPTNSAKIHAPKTAEDADRRCRLIFKHGSDV